MASRRLSAATGGRLSEDAFRTSHWKAHPKSTGAPFFCMGSLGLAQRQKQPAGFRDIPCRDVRAAGIGCQALRFAPEPGFLQFSVALSDDGITANVARLRQQAGELGGTPGEMRSLQVCVECGIGGPLFNECEFQRIGVVLHQHVGDASGFLAGRSDEAGDDLANRRGSFRTGSEMSDYSNSHGPYSVVFGSGAGNFGEAFAAPKRSTTWKRSRDRKGAVDTGIGHCFRRGALKMRMVILGHLQAESQLSATSRE